MSRVLMFKRFERFWHWSQALLIFVLLFTGFAIHGTYEVMRFSTAVQVHTLAAWALIVLWVFAIFWHFTTGEWRQYIPTRDGLFAVMHYYLIGTFTGASHPYKKTSKAKHNPLQRLAYLFFKVVISPIIWVSGLLYLFYNDWPATLAGALELETVALVHTGAAFAMLVFIIAHVYMTTMGKTLTSHIKPMITGYEDLDEHH
ncbi:cytochrome b/b6 domain-containing protein [Marinobacter sp. P4B1]|jgi:thiosulfate reductase cytochrome b subunit|uniref:cytochrome b/b6 domain-containing protein n=1 Tax=Marinobacter sp. P4B1 TaxID=1119533 RepID=UPI00071E5210|nr:cytochrome b/b6 domain-containing protein [Marinobacter sp. P4B1]KRW81549.1 cytochrome b [Marinobacter sp. P4B1]